MPQEVPSIHSTRMLRAYRLNNVETVKMRNNLTVLDKAKQRELRIANQDIRLINRTLDYINSSSGQSPEGRPPEYVDRSKRAESAPLFMYGERIASRRSKKRFRRVQSAHHVGMSSIQKDNIDETDSQISNETTTNSGKQRPKSSPPKALSYMSNGYATDTLISTTYQDKTEDNIGISNAPVNSTNPYLTQINEEDAEVKELQVQLNQTSLTSEDTKLNRPKSRRRGVLHGRTHEMTKKVNAERVQMMSAKKSKPDTKQAWTAVSAQTKQEEVLNLKKYLQGDRQGVINSRIQDFMDMYPLKKY